MNEKWINRIDCIFTVLEIIEQQIDRIVTLPDRLMDLLDQSLKRMKRMVILRLIIVINRKIIEREMKNYDLLIEKAEPLAPPEPAQFIAHSTDGLSCKTSRPKRRWFSIWRNQTEQSR